MNAEQAKLITQLSSLQVTTRLDYKIMKRALEGEDTLHVSVHHIAFAEIVSLERRGFSVYKPFDNHNTVVISWK